MSPRRPPASIVSSLLFCAAIGALSVRAQEAAAPVQARPLDVTAGEVEGADVFIVPREGLLREKAKPDAKIVGKLPSGTRLSLLQSGDRWLSVELPDTRTAGFVAREVTLAFAPGTDGSLEMVTVARAYARSDTTRTLAVSLLSRAAARMRETGSPDPRVELLLGETSESLAAANGAFPAGVASRTITSPIHGDSSLYAGDAFEKAFELSAKDPSLARVRERAAAGRARMAYPETQASLAALWQETAAWLDLTETGTDPFVLRSCSERLGASSMVLGRYLLATGRLEEMVKLETRLRVASDHLARELAGRIDGRKLAARASLLTAMRGDGARAFPQEVSVKSGPKTTVVRIDGKLGALMLTSQSNVGATWTPIRASRAVPVLPVPGSLKVSPDGRSAAWIEVSGPSTLLPVIVSLEKDEPAREVAFLSSGRPLRDRALTHVVSSLAGFSRDGQRLGLSIQAWNETPGPEPRLSVVSAATGELLFETSRDEKSFRRLLGAGM
jgi:hypothetical protein